MKARIFGLALFLLNSYIAKSDYSDDADACLYGDVRLVGISSTSSEGTVEMCYDNQWGSVCDYLWSTDDAAVVCKQLGYNGTSSAYTRSHFGPSNGTVLLNGVACTGSEASLLECSRYFSIGSTGCDHSSDAGVACTSEPEASCTDGDVRLTGNVTSSQGTVEVCYQNTWGTVCDDTWDDRNAAVVCGQLSYHGPSTAYSGAFFGQGAGSILLGGLSCSGYEATLLQCARIFSIGTTGCYHSNDAGVSCTSAQLAKCTTGDIHLVGPGSTPSQGRVEVCYGNQWGTVCDYNWNTANAAVVCQQLGYNGYSSAVTGAYFGQGTGLILLGSVSCSGMETSLFSCARNGGSLGSTGCYHSQDAGVICSQLGVCTTNGDIRLEGGSSNGTVEVCYQNTWMTLCDDTWDHWDAAVVCGQLGYYGPSTALSNTTLQSGPSSIHLRGLACTGTETSLLSCIRQSIDLFSGCTTTAGVQCTLSAPCNAIGDVRLVGPGSTPSQGRVEVCYGNQWGTVCDYQWDISDAAVICKRLGYYGPSLAYGGAYYGQGNGSIYLSGLLCTGSESSLLECSRYLSIGATGCHHLQDAGVSCSVDPSHGCTAGAVRLAGGNSTEGRVELCHGNQWGTVCDYLWSSREASIVCRQLGFNGPSHAYGGAYFGLGTGAILLGGVACTGAERSLLECARYYGIGTAPCSHYQDVGVACTIGQIDSCTNGDIRLVGPGSTPSQGRVEVCYGNQWGTVCDYNWNTANAAVVCQQLGYNGTIAAYGGAYFGQGTGPVLFSGLFCNGPEQSLLECPRYYSISATPCSHLQDAGVVCAVA